jgi:hypothetical protein
MKTHGIEHGPPFSFGLCNVLASCTTNNNYVYKEPSKMLLSSCKDTWYILNDSHAQKQDRITMASPRMYKKILGYVYCEAFLHTFNMKICTHKTSLEVELLCSCNLTSKVVQFNVMKFTKNLMHYVHLEDIKTLCKNRNSP